MRKHPVMMTIAWFILIFASIPLGAYIGAIVAGPWHEPAGIYGGGVMMLLAYVWPTYLLFEPKK